MTSGDVSGGATDGRCVSSRSVSERGVGGDAMGDDVGISRVMDGGTTSSTRGAGVSIVGVVYADAAHGNRSEKCCAGVGSREAHGRDIVSTTKGIVAHGSGQKVSSFRSRNERFETLVRCICNSLK